MNADNFHPMQKVPPIAHALHHWQAEEGLLRYEYNGVDIIEVRVPAGTDLGFRHGSDGTMQSIQYFQQVYLSAAPACKANITLRVHHDALNMRPHRAAKDQAILGAQPGLTAYGVNGIYDPEWDLLLDWSGRPWKWLDAKLVKEDDTFSLVSFEADLNMSALFLNIRPWYYAKHLGFSYHRPWEHRTSPKAIAGWCSWEAYRRDLDIEKINEVAHFLNAKLKDYGLTCLQVDDGYQAMPLPVKAEMSMPEGWTTCDPEKFPDGHSSITAAIEDAGLTPGIWVNANITNPDFPKEHPDAVLWNEGEPLKGEWIDFLYNCEEKTLEEQIKPIFEQLKRLGYRYIKIDAIRHLLLDGLHECVRLGLMTNEDASRRFRAFMEASREGMGDDVFYLASWGVMQEVDGIADACRISMDANPTWAGVRMQLFESARWFHTHRVLFVNDPDHVCVRSKPEWVKSVLSLISLSGELYMLSDALNAYSDEKLDIIRKTLPPIETYAGETGPLSVEYPAYTWTKLHGFAVQSHETPVEMENVTAEEAANIAGWAPDRQTLNPFSTLWSFPMWHHGQSWRVMLRVATTPLEGGTIRAEQLALDPQKTYHAFDFWKQTYLGKISGSVSCEPLALGCCQVVAFYEASEMPMVIGSDRHVSMDAVSITAQQVDAGNLNLKLHGVIGTTISYTLSLPENSNWHVGGCSNCTAVLAQQKECFRLSVTFADSEADVTVVRT